MLTASVMYVDSSHNVTGSALQLTGVSDARMDPMIGGDADSPAGSRPLEHGHC